MRLYHGSCGKLYEFFVRNLYHHGIYVKERKTLVWKVVGMRLNPGLRQVPRLLPQWTMPRVGACICDWRWLCQAHIMMMIMFPIIMEVSQETQLPLEHYAIPSPIRLVAPKENYEMLRN